jgi:[ribosomal protein S5]-alanine N-acetyltransferase
MTNGFPCPYTLQDAHDWIKHNMSIAEQGPPQYFVLLDPMTDSAVGGMGIKPGTDVSAYTAEIGSWLGEEHWGCGIVSEALPAFTPWVWNHRALRGSGQASTTVMQRAGGSWRRRDIGTTGG